LIDRLLEIPDNGKAREVQARQFGE